MTDTDARLIAALAKMGLRSRPKTGYSTPAATGTPTALSMKAKKRFCRMLRSVP